MADLEGVTLGKYHLIEKIGRGGMSSVYKAFDLPNDRTVAVKVLAPALARDPSFRTRFQREASVLVSLRHPHIVPILDFGDHEGVAFLVMPLVEMGGLHRRLEQGDLRPSEGAQIIRQVASALQHAHEMGVVHRDVKPSNILLDGQGNAYLSDFGFAHIRNASLNLTGSAIIGTPAYMAPEQIRGGEVTPQSDQYALGIVLYEMSTGKLPFDAETPMAVAIKHATEPLPRPRLANPNLPDAIEAVLLKVLSKEPEDRYFSIGAFEQAFQAAMRRAYDPASGRLRSGAVTPLPLTQELPVPEIEPNRTISARGAVSERREAGWRRRLAAAALLLLVLCPSSFYLARAFFGGDAQNWFQQVLSYRTVNVQSTVNALFTANAPSEGTRLAPGELEAMVAASLTALAPSGATGPLVLALISPGESTQAAPSSAADSVTLSPAGTSTQPYNPTSSKAATSAGTESGIPTPTSLPVTSYPASDTPSSPSSSTPSSTPFASASPTLTQTQTPSASQPPPPTIDPCGGINLGGFATHGQDATWSLTNRNPLSIAVTGIRLAWPVDNQRLDEARFNGGVIWNAGDEESPTDISGGGPVSSGSSQGISFKFKRAAVPSGYSLRVTISNGCQFTSNP